MKRTEVSGMYQNRTEWKRSQPKADENKERSYLSVKGAFTQHLYYPTITKHSNLHWIDRLQFHWLTASIRYRIFGNALT